MSSVPKVIDQSRVDVLSQSRFETLGIIWERLRIWDCCSEIAMQFHNGRVEQRVAVLGDLVSFLSHTEMNVLAIYARVDDRPNDLRPSGVISANGGVGFHRGRGAVN